MNALLLLMLLVVAACHLPSAPFHLLRGANFVQHAALH